MLIRCIRPCRACLSAVFAVLSLVILWPIAPLAADPSSSLDLHMEMYYGGVRAGKMKLSVDFNDRSAISQLDLKSRGLVSLLTGYEGQSEAMSALAAEALPQSVRYDSTYKTNRYDRKIEIRYDEADGAIANLQTWKRGKPQDSRVPEDLWTATVDPLTAMLHVRHWIMALRSNAVSADDGQIIEVFDGRRRYTLDLALIERDRYDWNGDDVPVFRLKVRMEPLAGFSKKDVFANWTSGDDKRWIELVMTDSDNPAPLSLRTRGGGLETVIELTKICYDDQCQKAES